MALMDAGIALREHVAGLSVGLVSEVDPSTGEIKDYRILTDILVRVFVWFICVYQSFRSLISLVSALNDTSQV